MANKLSPSSRTRMASSWADVNAVLSAMITEYNVSTATLKFLEIVPFGAGLFLITILFTGSYFIETAISFGSSMARRIAKTKRIDSLLGFGPLIGRLSLKGRSIKPTAGLKPVKSRSINKNSMKIVAGLKPVVAQDYTDN
jgi:hypothetical protein